MCNQPIQPLHSNLYMRCIHKKHDYANILLSNALAALKLNTRKLLSNSILNPKLLIKKICIPKGISFPNRAFMLIKLIFFNFSIIEFYILLSIFIYDFKLLKYFSKYNFVLFKI